MSGPVMASRHPRNLSNRKPAPELRATTRATTSKKGVAVTHGTAEPAWRLAASSSNARRHLRGERFTNHEGRRRRVPVTTYQRDPMLRCTRNIIVLYGGSIEQLDAGTDYVRASHPIARLHPDAFTPDPRREF